MMSIFSNMVEDTMVFMDEYFQLLETPLMIVWPIYPTHYIDIKSVIWY